MFSYRALMFEGLVTYGALKWSLITVHFEMSSNRVLIFEGLVTNGALVWPFISVHLEMYS